MPAVNSTFAIGVVSCSARAFVVKIPPIANLQTVMQHKPLSPRVKTIQKLVEEKINTYLWR
jgi:hypothetical protein